MPNVWHSSYPKLGALPRQQRGSALTLQVSLTALYQILQEATALLVECLPDTQDSHRETAPPATIRAAAAPPPQDGVTQRPLCGVVRRFDTLVPDEQPQLRLMRDQLTTGRRRLRTPTGCPVRQRSTDLSPKPADVDLEAKSPCAIMQQSS
jgi:hypothetical protein